MRSPTFGSEMSSSILETSFVGKMSVRIVCLGAIWTGGTLAKDIMTPGYALPIGAMLKRRTTDVIPSLSGGLDSRADMEGPGERERILLCMRFRRDSLLFLVEIGPEDGTDR